MPSADWSTWPTRVLREVGASSWEEIIRVVDERRARDRARWAAQAHLRYWGTSGPARTNRGIRARRNDNDAKFNLDDQKDLGLGRLYDEHDNEDEASGSESVEESESSVDDAGEEGSEDSDEGDDEEDSEDDGDEDDDDGNEDEQDSDEKDDGGDKKTQLRK